MYLDAGNDQTNGITTHSTDDLTITEHRCLSVQKVGGQFNRDRDLGQFLETTAHGHAGVVRGTAGDEYYPPASADSADVLSQTTQGDLLVDNIQTSTHGVHNRLGLLENLLLHEVVERALHDLLKLQLQGLDSTDGGTTLPLSSSVDVQLTLVDVSNVVILEVQHLLRVLNDRGRIGTQEELGGDGHAVIGEERPGLRAVEKALIRGSKTALGAGPQAIESHVVRSLFSGQRARVGELNVHKVHLHLALGLYTHHKGRTLSCGDNLMGVVDRLQQQTESTLQLGNNSLGKRGEVDRRVLVVDVLCKLGDALGIGLTLKNHSPALQQSLQLLVVGDDAVVNDGEPRGGVTPRRG